MKEEKRHFFRSLIFPTLFMMACWVIFLWAQADHFSLTTWGVYPRKWSGLWGILTAPLAHGSLEHIVSNTLPILVLGTCLFYFYTPIAAEVLFWQYFSSGLWLWVIGRPAYHLGASTLIYSLAFFLLMSGFLRKNKALLAISLIVITFYGYLVWGVFPIEPEVSWEGHLSGLLSGIVLAFFFRREGPANDQIKVWDDSDLDGVEPYWELPEEQPEDPGISDDARPVHFRYHYKESGKPDEGQQL